MGLLSGLMGNASSVDATKLQEELKGILIPNEIVEAGFQVLRDQFIFTDKRLILIDKQGVSGRKVEYKSIPYKSIKYFSVETAGTFERDADLRIHMTGEVINKNLKKGIDIVGLQRMLAYYILK